MKNKKKYTYFYILLLPAFFLWAFWGGLTVREYTLCSSKIPKGKSVCIVHLSDLHSAIFGDNQKDLVKVIRNAKPDFIAMTGDMADDKEPITGAVRLLSATAEIAPVFYVSGNHEFWSGRIGEIRSFFKAHGAIVLENAYQEIVTANGVSLIIGGMDDPETSFYEKFGLNWSETLREISSPYGDSAHFSILLSHRPEPVEDYRSTSVDLVLSGHAHGGQIRIPPFLNGLYAPQQGLFPRYAGGLYQYENLTHIISRGLADTSPLPRVFNPPEVVVIHLTGTG